MTGNTNTPRNVIINGDCINVMRSFDRGTVDFILTDPPYVTNFRDRQGRTVANDDNGRWLRPAFNQMHRVLKDGGFCVSFYGWNKVDLFMDAWKSAGFRVVGHLVFRKRYASSARFLRYEHEQAYLLAKGNPTLPAQPIPDVLDFPCTGNRLHPTQKPVEALMPLIEAFTKPGELVLDPFCGSGSTLAAAQRSGRGWIGIELDNGHHHTASKRLAALQRQRAAALSRSPKSLLRRPFKYSLGLAFASLVLAGCATNRTPQFSYDADVPPLPVVQAAVTDDRPRPLHTPPAWTVARGGTAAGTPAARVENANAAARVEPRREGYYNAIQIYPWSEGALYQVYAAPGQITNITLEPGESLTGAGPIAAGDTARWIIGDTESGSGAARRVHILVKPTRPDIATNLVVTTDRRTYMIELRAREALYMPSVAWAYPARPAGQRQTVPATPIIPAEAARNYRYGLTGDSPPWRPISVFDDGRRVYVVFPRGIVQGEMPPIFVLGADGEPQVVNSRVHQNTLIVDRLFGAAELRLGSGNRQQTVRITRIEERQATSRPTSTGGSRS